VKILLTGANGFVGSHVLDRLTTAGHDVAIMIRRTSNTGFIEPHLARVDVRYGSLDEPGTLDRAVSGVSCVIHCAAVTKALRRRDYFAANAEGTLNLVEACNRAQPGPDRFIHVSSLAVSGPGTPARPAREDAPPHPVSAYGQSKALAEGHVRDRCRAAYTILRPAAVYGPRDSDFFLAFKTVAGGLAPLLGGGRQALSLAYVADVAEAIVLAAEGRAQSGGIHHVAHGRPTTQRGLLAAIGRALGREPLMFPVPGFMLYPACALRGVWARIVGSPSIMNLSKIPEYRAPGWVCTTESAHEALGFEAATSLEEGVRLTAEWYRSEGWL
jgi:nucleoside-diphosphate-sugar epimerase